MIPSAHGMQAAVAMGGAWDTVDASATKGGRAAIAHIVTSDLAAMLVRRSVTQRPLARATDGATRMVGASVAIRFQVKHAKSARQVALASNVKDFAPRWRRAARLAGAWLMEDVSATMKHPLLHVIIVA